MHHLGESNEVQSIRLTLMVTAAQLYRKMVNRFGKVSTCTYLRLRPVKGQQTN